MYIAYSSECESSKSCPFICEFSAEAAADDEKLLKKAEQILFRTFPKVMILYG